jgi:hypothetical protein
VITNLEPFRQTIEGGTSKAFAGGTQYFDKVTDAATTLAAMYVRDGRSPGEAAKLAADKVANEMYDFQGTYRIPRSRDVDAVISGAGMIENNIDLLTDRLGVELIPSAFGLEQFAPEHAANSVISAIQAGNASWVTAPGDDGLILTVAGRIIPNKEGEPLKFTWAEIEGTKQRTWLERLGTPTTGAGVGILPERPATGGKP